MRPPGNRSAMTSAASTSANPSAGVTIVSTTSPCRFSMQTYASFAGCPDVPTGTLAVLAQRLGRVWASPSMWYRLVRRFGGRRPRLRVHPAKPKVDLLARHANEVWHIDTTVIRLLDGTRTYVHAVIDNFSRREFWPCTLPTRSHQRTAWPSCSTPVAEPPVLRQE
jgi:hypothetical protein